MDTEDNDVMNGDYERKGIISEGDQHVPQDSGKDSTYPKERGEDCRERSKMMCYVPEQLLGWGGEGEPEQNIGGVQGRPIQRKFGAEE